MSATPEEVARETLEVVPLAMRVIRGHMRSQRTAELSVPQFRTLSFLERRPGASLTDVAEFIGLTLPTMSKLVDGLVARKLATRAFDPADRRCVILELTARGHSLLETARASTHDYLAELFATLVPAERDQVVAAFRALRPLLTSPDETHRPASRRDNVYSGN